MKTATLGTSDLEISRICFGCWQLSPNAWGDIDLGQWRSALLQALDLGITFIDTADAYGRGHAEACLGDLLAEQGLRDRCTIATKFYWRFVGENGYYPDTRPEHILRACEASLERLRTDVIDLYQVHAWDPLTRVDDVAAALLQLQQEGKVRHIGISNFTVPQMALYGQKITLQSAQPRYNLLDRDAEDGVFPHCRQHGMGTLVYSPLLRGLLTGKYDCDRTFDDSRATSPLFQQPAFAVLLRAVRDLLPLARDLELSLPELAVRWVLTHPAVTTAIVGIKTAEHVTSIAHAADDVLPPEVWHDMARIMENAKREAGV